MDSDRDNDDLRFSAACVVTVFDHDGSVTETVEVASDVAARRIARLATRRPGIAYATVRTPERTNVFARGKGRLRISRPE